MIDLNEDNLQEVIQDKERVFVQYGAGWCGMCRMLKPKIKNLSNSSENISFIYVDAEKYPESRKLAKVENLPTFAIFKNGELVNQAMGSKFEIVEGLVNEIASH